MLTIEKIDSIITNDKKELGDCAQKAKKVPEIKK